MQEDDGTDWMAAPHSMGTTIMAVQYKGGVVLGADSRTTTGVYVANRVSDKITALSDNVYLCRSGSAADSQVVSDYVRYFLSQHIIQLGRPATVKTAATLARELSYQNKSFLQTGLIVGGWDEYEGGSIFSIPLGGTVLRVPFAIGGSGSAYIYGFLDQAWKDGMDNKEAEALVVKAVSLAIARDCASGGVVRTVTISFCLAMQPVPSSFSISLVCSIESAPFPRSMLKVPPGTSTVETSCHFGTMNCRLDRLC